MSTGSRAVLLAVAVCLLAAGIALVNAPAETIPWAPRGPLERHVGNPREALAGLVLALIASVLAVAVTGSNVPASASEWPAAPTTARDQRPRVYFYGALALAGAVVLAAWMSGGAYSYAQPLLLAAVLGLAALALRAADRRRRRPSGLHAIDLAVAAALGALTAWLHSRGSTHWIFAYIGDEMPFFDMARAIARGERSWNAFDVVGGVYDTHAFLDSAYQALVMNALRRFDVIGWRASLALLAGASTGLLYASGVVLRGRVLGLAAAAVLGSSHYLMAFSHIGYNNPHAVFYEVLAAFFLALAWRTGRWHHHWLAGVALALGLYTFLAAAALWIVAAVVLVAETFRRRSWRHRLAVAWTGLGFAATVAPALWVTTPARLTQVVTRNSIELTVAHHPDVAIGEVQWDNFVRSVLAFWGNDLITGHHVGGPLVDPVTAGLLVLGLVAALASLGGFAERLALAWLLGGLVLIGISHYEVTPSTSRLLIVLPAVALLGGLAVNRLSLLADRRRQAVAGVAFALVLWLVLPALNVHQLFVASPRKMEPRRATMVLKALEEHTSRDVIDVGLADGDVPWVLSAYPWWQGRYRLFSDEQLRRGEPLPLERRPVVFVDASSAELADTVAGRLPSGYQRVVDQDASGRYQVTLFVPAPTADR
jgi:hypothetical protein